MVFISDTPVETGKVLRVIFEDDKRRLDNLNRRRGWLVAEMGGVLSDCQNEAQKQGWKAQRLPRGEDMQTEAEAMDMARNAVAGLVIDMFGREAFK